MAKSSHHDSNRSTLHSWVYRLLAKFIEHYGHILLTGWQLSQTKKEPFSALGPYKSSSAAPFKWFSVPCEGETTDFQGKDVLIQLWRDLDYALFAAFTRVDQLREVTDVVYRHNE